MLAQQLLNGLAQGSMYALIAVGFALIIGTLKLVTFAHGEVFMARGLRGLHRGRHGRRQPALGLRPGHPGGRGAGGAHRVPGLPPAARRSAHLLPPGHHRPFHHSGERRPTTLGSRHQVVPGWIEHRYDHRAGPHLQRPATRRLRGNGDHDRPHLPAPGQDQGGHGNPRCRPGPRGGLRAGSRHQPHLLPYFRPGLGAGRAGGGAGRHSTTTPSIPPWAA